MKNAKKTIAMSYHGWQNKICLKPQIIFKGVDIKYKYKTKFLDVHLTEDTKCDVHIKI